MRRALAFLTPLGGAAVPDRATLSWFPVAGALIGLAVGGAWWGADRLWPPFTAAAIAVTVDLGLTGLLHLDGLADSADGLLPPLARERRLAVMAEPTVGAYGVAAVVIVLVLRTAALTSMHPSVLLLAALWCASRTAMAVGARALPYARRDRPGHRPARGAMASGRRSRRRTGGRAPCSPPAAAPSRWSPCWPRAVAPRSSWSSGGDGSAASPVTCSGRPV